MVMATIITPKIRIRACHGHWVLFAKNTPRNVSNHDCRVSDSTKNWAATIPIEIDDDRKRDDSKVYVRQGYGAINKRNDRKGGLLKNCLGGSRGSEGFWIQLEDERGHQRSPSNACAKRAWQAARLSADKEIESLKQRLEEMEEQKILLNTQIDSLESRMEEAEGEIVILSEKLFHILSPENNAWISRVMDNLSKYAVKEKEGGV